MHKICYYPALGIWLSLLAGCGSASSEPAKPVSPGVDAQQVSDAALIASGKAAFVVNCAACHTVDDGGGAKTGPNLYAVVGRKAGTEEEFAYSDALGSSRIIWSEVELHAFLTNPRARIKGTNMTVGAISNDSKRKAVIAYLKDQSSN